MALAESMKNFVNDVKASRRSRHEFVKGNKENTKNIMAENNKFLQNIHEQNKINAQQTHAFLKSSKENRMQSYKQIMDTIHEDLARIHQAKEAITQGANAMIQEFRQDTQMAHTYWASLSNDEPITEPKATVEKAKEKKEPSAEKNPDSTESKKEE
jgi:hypothetical protein